MKISIIRMVIILAMCVFATIGLIFGTILLKKLIDLF